MVKVFIVSLLILICTILPACSQPVAITEYKEIECDDALFMAWTTNVDTRGTIQYCYNGKCYWTGDSEWGKLHTITMPDYYDLTIWATDEKGNRASLKVR